MREFFKDAEAIKGRLRTVSRMDDRDNNLQQGHNQAPGVKIS